MMTEFRIVPLMEMHREAIHTLLTRHWGSTRIVSRGRVHEADQLPAFVALRDHELIGLVTYDLDGDQCEIVSLNSMVEKQGIGTGLLDSVRIWAVLEGCKRIWLVTTNDNKAAQRFYANRGFTVKAVYQGIIEEYRKLKPEIPEAGVDGVPITDEIEMEMEL